MLCNYYNLFNYDYSLSNQIFKHQLTPLYMVLLNSLINAPRVVKHFPHLLYRGLVCILAKIIGSLSNPDPFYSFRNLKLFYFKIHFNIIP